MKPFNEPLLKRNSSLSLFACASLTALLTACNGGGDSSSETPVVTAPTDNTAIYSTNIRDNILVGERASINVANHVTTSDASAYSITSVESMSGDVCQVTNIGTDSFEVASTETQDCLFQYHVSAINGTASSASYARIAAAPTYASTALPRVTTSTLEGQEITIDLETELGTSTPDATYQLQEQLVVIGNGSATYLDENRIQFVPSAKGQTEIYYSYESDTDIKQGTISVSVSELTENTPPSAEVFAHEELIKLGESITVDVAPHVEDVDGDAVQLIGIEDFNSTTALSSPTDVTNTQFTFESTTPGAHDVAYTVSDHMGGYTTSVARIEVEPDFSLIQDWEDIVTYDPVIDSDIRFFAPMTKVYADYVNAQYTSTYTENGENGLKDAEVVMQTLSQARQYCKVRGGRLPLQRELETLIANETSAFSNHNWPTSKKYWTAENVSETNAATVNLNDGVIGNQSKTVAMYTTCVDLSDEAVRDFSVLVLEQSATGNEYSYQIEVLHPDGGAGMYQDVELEALSDAGVFESGTSALNLVMDTEGKQVVSYFDTSFSKSVIASEVSSNRDLFPFVPDEGASALETTDPSKWNHVDTRYGLSLPEIGENGVPVLFTYGSPDGMGSSTVYKDSFSGSDFVMYLHIRNVGVLSHGATSFFIQQQGNTPDSSWYDVTRAEPGAPLTSDTFNIVTHFFNGEFNFYNGFNNLVGAAQANVRHEDRHLWFQKKGAQLYHYSSTSKVRPEEPDFITTFDWGDIDPTKPFWVGAGGATNYEDVEAYIVDANFSSYL